MACGIIGETTTFTCTIQEFQTAVVEMQEYIQCMQITIANNLNFIL